MMNNYSYAYAETLEVLDNMEEIYIQKIPQKLIDFLRENSSKDYQNHITTDKPLKNQNLNQTTLNLLALINLKYWVESEEHKKELLKKYKDNEKKEIERLNKHFDSSSIFEKNNEEKQENNQINLEEKIENIEINKENLPVERKSIFKRFIDFLKSKIFEN